MVLDLHVLNLIRVLFQLGGFNILRINLQHWK